MSKSSNVACISVFLQENRPATVTIAEEGKAPQELAEAIGELERCGVRYIVFPLESQMLRWQEHVGKPLSEAETMGISKIDLKSSLTEVDQVSQTAQLQVDALMLQLLEALRLADSIAPALANKATAICEEVRSLVYSAMNDINFIAGEHGAHHEAERICAEVAHV